VDNRRQCESGYESELAGEILRGERVLEDREHPGAVAHQQATEAEGAQVMEYALSYASQGYAVFPLKPNTKTPLTEHGFKDATKDPEAIRRWWTEWPEANVGVATGRVSGIVVLDIDRKHGVDGAVSAAELELPKTLTIRTPSGGFHLFYKAPTGVIVPRRIGVKPGLDVLGEGGYVVAAGSYINGTAYEIVRNLPIADCPEVLINLAGKASVTQEPAKDSKKIGAGQRNNYLTSVGGKLRRIGFSTDEMVAALLAINTSRCDPPCSEAEVRRTAASVARYEPDKDGSETGSPIAVKPLAELLAANYPPIEFVSDPALQHPGLALLFGPSGISKTYFTLAWALSVAAGQPFLGWKTATPRGVLYIDGELGGRTMQQRVKLLSSGHEITLNAPFYVSSFDDQASGLFPNIEDEEQHSRYLLGIPDDVQLVVLDSLSTLASLEDSNDAKSWGPVQRMLLGLRRRGLSCIVVHHANKGGSDQLGTSRRIHVMDTVISLREHKDEDGSAPGHQDVEVHIPKGRNLPKNMKDPFIATLCSQGIVNGAPESMFWTRGDLLTRKTNQVEELLRAGVPISAVIQETGCATSLAYRIKDRLVANGSMKWTGSSKGRKRKDLDD
jgi:hypothetical protein